MGYSGYSYGVVAVRSTDSWIFGGLLDVGVSRCDGFFGGTDVIANHKTTAVCTRVLNNQIQEYIRAYLTAGFWTCVKMFFLRTR